MSQELINRSADLQRLRDEGYDVQVREGALVIGSVPYVDSTGDVKFGKLVSELTLAGNVTATPSTHVVFFAGNHPCNKDGSQISAIQHGTGINRFEGGILVNHSFSCKPNGGYKDYYDKMTTYAAIISSPAEAIDPNVTPKVFPVVTADNEESIFNYIDTASSRAGIYAITKKLEVGRVAVVGLGGTGSYVLDLIAKTPVKEIHIFDGDQFSQHNAFRSPGAPSVEELQRKPLKVTHFQELYSKMRRHIVAHPYFINAQNVGELLEMDFVFLCIDGGSEKRLIFESLEAGRKPFVDVGMGVYEVEHKLGGILRVTTMTPGGYQERARKSVSLAEDDVQDEYSRNIQIADLNALNAALAVIRWKKLLGFYVDFEREHYSTYTIDGNMLTNEVQV
jgi:hypothetical protein